MLNFPQVPPRHPHETVTMCQVCWSTADGTVHKSEPLPQEVAYFRAREEKQGRLRLACWVEPCVEAYGDDQPEDEDLTLRRQ